MGHLVLIVEPDQFVEPNRFTILSTTCCFKLRDSSTAEIVFAVAKEKSQVVALQKCLNWLRFKSSYRLRLNIGIRITSNWRIAVSVVPEECFQLSGTKDGRFDLSIKDFDCIGSDTTISEIESIIKKWAQRNHVNIALLF